MRQEKKGNMLIMDNPCCCKILLGLAQGDLGKTDNNALAALAECCSEVCGALAAAIAALYTAKAPEEAAACQDRLMDWFAERYGGYDCEAVAAGVSALKDEVCPKVILATYLELRGYLDPDNHLSEKTLI